jgi:hypothetical protein
LSSKWISSTSLLCKSGQGSIGSAPVTFVSYGFAFDVRVGNIPIPNVGVVLTSAPRNLPATGSWILQTTGANFQNFDFSPAMVLTGSGQQATFWKSHSSLVVRSACGGGATALVIVSISDMKSTTVNLSSHFAFLFTDNSVSSTIKSAVFKFPATSGGSSLFFRGKNMGLFGISAAARLRSTACGVSKWISESTLSCKISAGYGTNNILVISLNSVSLKFSNSSALRLAYAAPILTNYSVSVSNPNNVILSGSNFAPFNSDVTADIGSVGVIPVGPMQTQILFTSDALTQGKSVRQIEVRLQMNSTRLDDVVVSLETLPFVGRIFLLKSQCFGCITTGNDTTVTFVFSDSALMLAPASDCSSSDAYRPSIPFSTLFTHVGLLFLQVTSGSMPLLFLSSSIKIIQSSINIVADKVYPSLGIKWYSDSSIEFSFPSILGSNHSFEATVDGQLSNMMVGLSYPNPIIESQGAIRCVPVTGAAIISTYGSFFGQRSNTLALRIGRSSCLSSTWISDKVVVCKSSAGISTANLWGLRATVARLVSFVTSTVKNESPALVSSNFINDFVSTGNFFILASGGRFGTSTVSPQSRISMSSTRSTNWFSDTSLYSLVASKWKFQMQTVVTVLMSSSYIENSTLLSQSVQVIVPNTCTPRTGSTLITLSGAGFVSRFSSLQVRIGDCAASSTLWRSDSFIISRNSRIGFGYPRGVTVSVPEWQLPAISFESVFAQAPSSELYGTFSFQNRSFASPPYWHGWSILTVQGLNFGFLESTKFKSLSMDPNIPCENARWISDTSLSAACFVSPPGSEVLFRLSGLQSSQDDQVMNLRSQFSLINIFKPYVLDFPGQIHIQSKHSSYNQAIGRCCSVFTNQWKCVVVHIRQRFFKCLRCHC